jgi:NAD(P)H-hydrate epimerase
MKEVMTKPLKSKDGLITKDDCHKLLEEIQNADLCLIGPGLGRSEDLTYIIRNIISSEIATPLVIDADGLNAISEDTSILENHKMPIILTPHIGEFSRLTKVSCEEILKEPKKYALEFAKKFNVVLVLKSHKTLVAEPSGEVFENVLGNPGMATGGSGDVLAGVIVSLLGQGIAPLKAAACGAWLHGAAGDICEKEIGQYGMLPSDMVNVLPRLLK